MDDGEVVGYKNLLLGCGRARAKRVGLPGREDWTGELVTVDMNPQVGATVVCELGGRMLPFSDEEFDEVHAYDSLEHWGKMGDWRGWFDEMADYWRVLKPGGVFCAIVPVGSDWFADPGHVRFFTQSWFLMLDRQIVQEKLDAGLPITDYRWYWKRDFRLAHCEYVGDPHHHMAVVLEKR